MSLGEMNSLSVLTALTMILRNIRYIALNCVELVLDCDVVWRVEWKTGFEISFKIHGAFGLML